MPKRLTSEEKEQIVARYGAGTSTAALAVEFGVIQDSIRRALDRAGVELRPRGLTKLQEVDIAQKYLAGVSGVVLGKEYGVGPGTICAILERQGIPRRQQVNYTFDTHFFDEVDSEEKAYILGFLYADGYNGEKERGWGVSIGLAAKDVEILYKFKQCLGSNHPFHHRKALDQYTLRLHNRHFSQRLAQLGCHIRKTFTLTFPEWMPDQLLPHFIRGYNDGDGHIHFDGDKGVTVGALGTDAFIKRLASVIVKECNVHVSFRPHPVSPGILSYQVRGRDQVSIVLAWLYKDATIYLERKKRKAEQVLAPVYYTTKPNGSRCHLATLSEAQVLAIKEAILNGQNNKKIRVNIKVSVEQLCDIRNGRTWHHLTGFLGNATHSAGQASGSTHGMAKLTEQNVLEIKGLIESGASHPDIAMRYGVTKDIISKIRCGKVWSHTTGYVYKPQGKARRGEENRNAKITTQQAQEIRDLLKSGQTGRNLAKQYGVSPSMISAINRGHTWKDE